MISISVLKPGIPLKLMSLKVIYSLEFTPDGKQIKRIIENVDSLLSAQFFEQALRNAGAH